MDNIEKKCEHYGATYIVSDGYCKQCWKRIPTTASPKEELLDGVKKAEWHFLLIKTLLVMLIFTLKTRVKSSF